MTMLFRYNVYSVYMLVYVYSILYNVGALICINSYLNNAQMIMS